MEPRNDIQKWGWLIWLLHWLGSIEHNYLSNQSKMDKGDAPGYVGKQTLIFDMPMSWAPQRFTCWWWTISCHAELPQEWHDFMSLVPGCTMGMPAYASCTPDVRHASSEGGPWRATTPPFSGPGLYCITLWTSACRMCSSGRTRQAWCALAQPQQTSLFDKIRVCWRFWTTCFKSILYTFPSLLAKFIATWLYTFGVKTTNQSAVPLLCNSVLYVPCCEEKLAPDLFPGWRWRSFTNGCNAFGTPTRPNCNTPKDVVLNGWAPHT